MPLTEFLYRCPRCGSAPLEGAKTRARCAGCDSRYEAAPRDGGIHVVGPEGTRIEPAWKLAVAMEKRGGALPSGGGAGEGLSYHATATMRVSTDQEPLKHKDHVVGFIEKFGPATPGTVSITPTVLRFETKDGEVHEWPLGEIRALQTSSSTVQITLAGSVLVSFRLEDDSTRRWEQMLSRALRRLWRREGRGEIVEFQPRIRAEAHG